MQLLDDINDEIAACEKAQSWTSGVATRSGWVGELKGLAVGAEALETAIQFRDEASDYEEWAERQIAYDLTLTDFVEAARVATDKQYELTETVARRANIFDAREAIINKYNVEPNAETIEQLLEEVRNFGWNVDDTINGNRDGIVLNDQEAYSYATCRRFDSYEDPGYVTFDLETGEVQRW